ncbi:MAG: lysylphosphatidylglycerol synthase domain-containing protein [Burkholderiales bacterium]
MRVGKVAVVVAPVVLAGALFFIAIKLGDPARALPQIRRLPPWVLVAALAMAIVYLGLKAWQLHLLLANLGIRPDWRRLGLAFAVGELAVTLPFGIFAQNWVLARTGRAHFGETAAATVVMLLVEIMIVLLLLAVVGIRGWPVVRPIAIAAAVALFLLVAFVLHFEATVRRLAQRFRQPALHRALTAAIDLICGMERLSNMHLLAINFAIAAAYLGALVVAFMIVGQHVGVARFGFLMAATTYAAALAVVFLTGGLVSQIGTVEVLGMGAAQAAWGIPYAEGLALMLGFRVVWTGAMWLCNLPIVVLLWRA